MSDVLNNKTDNIIQISAFNPYDTAPRFFFSIRNAFNGIYIVMCTKSNFRQIVHSYVQYNIPAIFEHQNIQYSKTMYGCTRAKEYTCLYIINSALYTMIIYMSKLFKIKL